MKNKVMFIYPSICFINRGNFIREFIIIKTMSSFMYDMANNSNRTNNQRQQPNYGQNQGRSNEKHYQNSRQNQGYQHNNQSGNQYRNQPGKQYGQRNKPFNQNSYQNNQMHQPRQQQQFDEQMPNPYSSGYHQQGYNQQGFRQQGYNQQGYGQQGYNQGYNQQGYNQPNHRQSDQRQGGYNQNYGGQNKFSQGGYGQNQKWRGNNQQNEYRNNKYQQNDYGQRQNQYGNRNNDYGQRQNKPFNNQKNFNNYPREQRQEHYNYYEEEDHFPIESIKPTERNTSYNDRRPQMQQKRDGPFQKPNKSREKKKLTAADLPPFHTIHEIKIPHGLRNAQKKLPLVWETEGSEGEIRKVQMLLSGRNLQEGNEGEGNGFLDFTSSKKERAVNEQGMEDFEEVTGMSYSKWASQGERLAELMKEEILRLGVR